MLGDHSPPQVGTSGEKQWDELADLYYDPSGAASFVTYWNLVQGTKKTKRQTDIKPENVQRWLEQQDAYTLHKPLRKRIPRNQHTVSNLFDLWELEFVDVQSLAKHKDSHRYLLPVVDVFSKYLHIVPLKSKTGKAVSETFESVLNEVRYMNPIQRRPVWIRTDKCKEFLGSGFPRFIEEGGHTVSSL